MAGGLDENVAKVSIELLMPLSLQLFSKHADVGPAIELRALLLYHTVSATTNAIGVPYRLTCMCGAFKRQTQVADQTATA